MLAGVGTSSKEADSLGRVRTYERRQQAKERSHGVGRNSEGVEASVGLQAR